MKDISTVFACEAARKEIDAISSRKQAVFNANLCCIESTVGEWLNDPDGLRLPLRPGLWLCQVYVPEALDIDDISLYVQASEEQ